MLATESEAIASPLEQWSLNERMRHIPDAASIAAKLDVDIRQRIEKLWLPFSDLSAADPRHAPLEGEFRALYRWLDRTSEVARRTRGGGHPPQDLAGRLRWSLGQAVSSVMTLEGSAFGRRYPFHTFERSNAEPLRGAVLSVLDRLQRVTELVREIDPEIDERLYENLVRLNEPLRREPIA